MQSSLHAKQLPNPPGHKALWPNGLGNYFLCKRSAVQTLLWSLEFVIQVNLEHDTIAATIENLEKGVSYVQN